MSEKPALIFDFGNVIAFFDYGRASTALGERLGIDGPQLLALLRERGLNALIIRYESGQISDEVFYREFIDLAGLELSYETFVAAWSDIFQLNEPVAALIEPLKQSGYTLVLGSNTNALHAKQFRDQFATTLQHFNDLVLSYQVGHVKPSREFYLACAKSAGRAPEACVFIDDLAENIAGAKAAGLQGIHFETVPNLMADLKALGVNLG